MSRRPVRDWVDKVNASLAFPPQISKQLVKVVTGKRQLAQ